MVLLKFFILAHHGNKFSRSETSDNMCSEFTILIFWIDHYNSKWFLSSDSIYSDIGTLPFLYMNLHWLINFIPGNTFNNIIKLCYHINLETGTVFFSYTVLKNFPCIHIFQRYSFKTSLRSAQSAFPSLIGKSSSFSSSHKSVASMQKLWRTQLAMIVWLVKAIHRMQIWQTTRTAQN